MSFCISLSSSSLLHNTLVLFTREPERFPAAPSPLSLFRSLHLPPLLIHTNHALLQTIMTAPSSSCPPSPSSSHHFVLHPPPFINRRLPLTTFARQPFPRLSIDSQPPSSGHCLAVASTFFLLLHPLLVLFFFFF